MPEIINIVVAFPDPVITQIGPVLPDPIIHSVEIAQIGPAGADGGRIQVAAAEDLPAFAVVSSSGLRSDSGNPTTHFGRVIGLSVAAALSGAIVTVAMEGELTNSLWNWTPSQKLFLNGTVLSASPPSSGFSQLIGLARNATTIIINLGQPVLT